MCLWVAVTVDKYELPIAVADTSVELGKMLGMKPNTIAQAYKRHKDVQAVKTKIIKVEIDK